MNERWNVLTYRDYDFKDGDRQIKGRTLHCYRKNSNDGWPGVEYGKFSVPFGSDAYNTAVKPGGEYEIGFNRFGKVSVIVPVG